MIMIGCNTESPRILISSEFYEVSPKEIIVSSNYADKFSKPIVQSYDGMEFVYSLNSQRNSIEIFDLALLQPVKSLKFSSEGPNAVGNIYEFLPQGRDSLFLLTDYTLSLVDNKGIVKTSLNIYDHPDFGDFFLHPKGTLGRYGLAYDPMSTTVYGRGVNKNLLREDKEFYNIPIEAAISLTDTSLTFSDISFPDIYQDEFQFGVLSYGSRTVNNQVFIYSFHVDPTIYTYSISNKKSSVYRNEPVKPVGLRRDQVDHNSLFMNLLDNDVYLEVIPDTFRGLYYQFVLRKIERTDVDGNMTDPGTKSIELRIFNESFDLLGFVSLDYSTYLPIDSFVSSEGLWINKETSYRLNNRQNLIEYDLFKFDSSKLGN